MLNLLAWLLRYFQPQEGWLHFVLALFAVFCLPLALIWANGDMDATGLLVVTGVAVAIALRAARSRLPARAGAILSAVSGLAIVAILAGQLVPPPSLLWREAGYSLRFLRRMFAGESSGPLPFSAAAKFVWQQLMTLGTRVWWWGQTVASGEVARDNIAFLLLAMLLVWMLAFLAVWQVYRRHSVLAGLVPSGAAVATVAFFAGGLSTFYLVVFLLCTLSLLAVTHLALQRERWEQAGIDHPGELDMELALALAPCLALILALAILFPVIHPRQIGDAFWKVMYGPWAEVEQAAERLFGPIDPSQANGGRAGGVLPQAHLLGGAAELAQTITFYVTTSDPPPPRPKPDDPRPNDPLPPRRYWRSATYDTYSGQGWSNGPLEQRTSPANQPVEQNQRPGSDLHQQFDLVTSDMPLLYAVNAPLEIDHQVQTWWRAPGDLALLSSSATRYDVLSRAPEPTADDLRLAPQSLPPGVAERYLALPDTIPMRVLELTREIVDHNETRYDQAHAIEMFLRTYTYTLDVSIPPGNRDLVDYFLFDLQEGYCDYYASAMVVMARAAGIPARLATGYAQGTYDHTTARWVVTEKDGHSWVEVFFDDIGWVEFEPTAGQPALMRSSSGDPDQAVLPIPARVKGQKTTPWTLLALGGMLVLLMASVLWFWHAQRHRAHPAAELVLDRQARLLRWGARLGQPLRDGQTPSEYASTLANGLHSRGRDAALGPVHQASVEAPRQVETLTEAFVRAQYDRKPLSSREIWHVRDLWLRLRRHLWWIWLGR